MARTLAAAALGLLIALGAVACGSGDGAASAAADPAAVDERVDLTLPSIPGHQYRAVCEELSAHNGRPYILTKWLDSREKAVEYGSYHGSHKAKWHRWKLEEREKPALNAQ